MYGMLFVYGRNNDANFDGNGTVQIFGSAVVQGHVKINGGIDLVYSSAMEAGVRGILNPYTFGRLPGSWLDARTVY